MKGAAAELTEHPTPQNQHAPQGGAMSDNTAPAAVERTWTFVGHWNNDRIVIEDIIDGEVPDDRPDTGRWEQGLWAASGTGTDLDATMAAVIAEYEDALHD